MSENDREIAVSEERRRHKRRIEDRSENPSNGGFSEKTITTAKSLRRQLHILTIMTGVLYLVIAGTILWMRLQQNTNTKSLCALRHESQARIREEQSFLKIHHPQLKSVEDLYSHSISDDQSTIEALKVLGTC